MLQRCGTQFPEEESHLATPAEDDSAKKRKNSLRVLKILEEEDILLERCRRPFRNCWPRPGQHDANGWLRQTLRVGGEFGRALELVERCLQSSPDDRELGVLKLQIESDQAKRQRMQAIAGATEEAQRYLRDGQVALAIEVLQRSATRFPDDEVVSKLLRGAEERLRKETELNSIRRPGGCIAARRAGRRSVVLLENRLPKEPGIWRIAGRGTQRAEH